MTTETQKKLVTFGGEFFEADFQRKDRAADRDGAFYLFHITDLKAGRGERLISLFRFGPKEMVAQNYDARLESVRLNTIRRAFDSVVISFDDPYDEEKYKELPLTAADFSAQPAVSDAEIQQFIMQQAYWLSWKYANRYPVQFDGLVDLEYLGVDELTVRKNQWLLEQKGLLEKSNLPGNGSPTAKLIELYESHRSAQLPNESVFPAGTQYEAFKAVTAILQSAKTEILIADNYLNDEVLDMLAAVPIRPPIRMLTHKPRADFKVAVQRFTSQYGGSVEVRLHNAQIHDRAIVLDGTHFYALGGSIKDLGKTLSLLNRLEDVAAITKLRTVLQGIWTAATPL